jgi:hypothetical protein
MKNTVMIPFVFLGNLVLWTVLLSVFSAPASYTALVSLSTRQFYAFLISVITLALYLLPIAVMLSLLFLFLYLLRHRTVVFMSVPLVLILAAASVVFLIPLSYRVSAGLTARTESDVVTVRPETRLFPPGYIRSGDGGKRIFWMDEAGAGRRARGVVTVDRATMPGSKAMSVFSTAEYEPLTRGLSADGTLILVPAGGEDTLLSTRLEPPSFLVRLVRDVNFALNEFKAASVRGKTAFIVVTGSFFALVLSLYFVSRASAWRLLNALLTMVAFRFALFAYPYAFDGPVFDTVRGIAPRFLPDALVPSAVTLACAALVSLAGIASFVFVAIRRRRTGAAYE